MKVSEIMQTTLTTVDPEATIGEAATLMGGRGIGSVLVCDGERLLGILTERDLVRALSETHDAPARPVAEWMTRSPQTAAPDTDAKAALRQMIEGGFRHLPICDGERVSGVVSIRDLAGALND